MKLAAPLLRRIVTVSSKRLLDGEIAVAVEVEVGDQRPRSGRMPAGSGLDGGWANFAEPLLRRIVTLLEVAVRGRQVEVGVAVEVGGGD